jgi:hypothetical protein
MKKIAIIFFVISILFAISFVLFLIFPLKAGIPCICPQELRWQIDTVIRPLLVKDVDCSLLGCAIDYYIFPIDLLIIAVIFFILGLLLNKKAHSSTVPSDLK